MSQNSWRPVAIRVRQVQRISFWTSNIVHWNPLSRQNGRLLRKSARIELLQLQMKESDLLARFTETHPDVIASRNRIQQLEKLIPEIPNDEEYFQAASEQLNDLMELRFRESTLFYSGRSATAEFRSTQEQIQHLRDEIAKIRSQLGVKNQLEGKWQVLAYELSGKPQPVLNVDEMTIEFQGDKMIFSTRDNDKRKATFRLTQTAPYSHIDYSSEGESYKGIFELQGDILQIVASPKSRPTKMSSEEDRVTRDTARLIMKRVKKAEFLDKAADKNRYLAGQITVKGIVENADKDIEIWYSTMPESLWYCPGVNIVTHERGYELIFPRWNALDSSHIDFKG